MWFIFKCFYYKIKLIINLLQIFELNVKVIQNCFKLELILNFYLM